MRPGQERLLELVRTGHCTATHIATATAWPVTLIDRELQNLVTAGHLRRVNNQYAIAERVAAPAPQKETPAMAEKKTCVRCLEDKKLDDFGDDARTPDGKSKLCRQCRGKPTHGETPAGKAAARARRKANGKTLHQVVRRHAAQKVVPLPAGVTAAALAELKLRRAVIDEAIAALEKLAA